MSHSHKTTQKHPRRLPNGTTRLPGRALYDDELNTWGRENIPGYRGTYTRTDAEKIIPRLGAGQSVIINLDPHWKHGGTHWVALRVSEWAPLAYYKDSFGAPPPDDVRESVGRRGLGLVYGNRIRQKLREENCGRRAAEWLQAMADAGPHEIAYFRHTET